jgi:hypothetical protein
MKQQRVFEYEGDLDEHSDCIVKMRAENGARWRRAQRLAEEGAILRLKA